MARTIEYEQLPYYGVITMMNTCNIRVRVTETVEGAIRPIVRVIEVRGAGAVTSDFSTSLVSKAARELASVKIASWRDSNGQEVSTIGPDRKCLDAPEDLRQEVLDFIGEKMLDLYAELKIDYDFSPITAVCKAVTASEKSFEAVSKDTPTAERLAFSPFFTKKDHTKRPKRDSWFTPSITSVNDGEACLISTTTPLDRKVITIITPVKDRFYCEMAYSKVVKNVFKRGKSIPFTRWMPVECKTLKCIDDIIDNVVNAHKTMYDIDDAVIARKMSVKEQSAQLLKDIGMTGIVSNDERVEIKVYFSAEEDLKDNRQHMRSWVRISQNKSGYSLDSASLPPLTIDDLKRVLSVLDERVTDHAADVKLEGV